MIDKKDREIAIKISGVKKKYRLGQIGGGTLQRDLQSWWARKRGKEDPNTKIGANQRSNGEMFMALDGIDLTIYQGEAIGIIGNNGAGKSTLLKLLSRVTAPTEGTIDIYGRIASMLEVGTGFHGEMTGRENVYLNGAILGMTREEIDAKMEQIIDFSEVREFIDTPVKRYSSGMYVKLAFSVAAHLDSEIMIMDEVLAVGDMAFQKKCLNKMREAANEEGRTVLYVSHNMNTIRQLCDRCIVMDEGKIVFEGDVEGAIELYSNARGSVQSEYVYKKGHHINPRSTDNFIISSLKMSNNELPICEYGGKIEFDLTCVSKIELVDLYFRYEVQYQDGTIAGTMLSSSGVCFAPGEEKQIHMKINTTHLVPGHYKINIVTYLFNEFGDFQFIDGVYPGLFLEVLDTINEENKLNWLHQFWGHVRLNDVMIEDLNAKCGNKTE